MDRKHPQIYGADVMAGFGLTCLNGPCSFSSSSNDLRCACSLASFTGKGYLAKSTFYFLRAFFMKLKMTSYLLGCILYLNIIRAVSGKNQKQP